MKSSISKAKPPTPLKIGLVLDDSLDRQDGVQQYVRSLGGWLAAQGHTVHYLAGESRGDGKTVHSLSRNVAVRFNRNRLTIPLPASNRTIRRLLTAERYDVLHVQLPHSPFMAGKIIKAAPVSTAVVGTFHILPFGRLQRAGSKALGLVQRGDMRRLDAACSVSPAAADFAYSHFGLASIVIPNMVDLQPFNSRLHPHPGRLVFLGRLVPRKGCREFLAAVAALPAELRGSLEILIAGDGAQRRQLEAFARQHGLPNVIFLGRVSEDHKASLLASAALAVFPSLGGESFGIVLIEAMAAGAGVVLGGNNPGYQSVLADWPETLIEPRDTIAFAASLQQFLTNLPLCQRLHAAQQQHVKRYDTGVVGQEIMTMYREALLHRRPGMR